MACACGSKGSFVVVKPDTTVLPTTYRTEVEALAVARRHPGSVVKKA